MKRMDLIPQIKFMLVYDEIVDGPELEKLIEADEKTRGEFQDRNSEKDDREENEDGSDAEKL